MKYGPKVLLPAVFGIVVLGGSLWLAQTRGLSPTSGKPVVIASFYPLYFFTAAIAGDRLTVQNITPAGAEPHDYEPTARQVAAIESARLVVINGALLESWFGKVKPDLDAKKIAVTVATAGISLKEAGGEDERETVTAKAALDPHVWLDPKLAMRQVDTITAGLASIDEAHRSAYMTNADVLKRQLVDLDNLFQRGLATCVQKSFVTSHAAFGYLADRYGLTQVPITGLSPDAEPTADKLKQVVEFVRREHIKYIFFESLVSPKISETIARETGAQTLVLDPIEGITDDESARGEDYFSVQKQNLKNLQLALECR